jgi:hypothetical protein
MLVIQQEYQSSFDTAMHCVVECEHCAKACMGHPDMVKCAQMCLDCAEVCQTLATYMVRGSYFIFHLARACADICEACAQECEKYNLEHCQKCAKVCRQAAEEYRKIASVGAARV